jgi:RNA polymerase sigma-70 factor (ECF subfamily)
VVQETFVKVHQNLPGFRTHASFGAWTFKIAHNLCKDILRARLRRKGIQFFAFDPQSLSDEETNEGAVNVVSQVPDPSLNPAQLLDMTEQGAIIERSLKDLPDNQRCVLILHDIEGFSYQEISDIVGANIGTVRSRLHYGRLKLRELLEPYFSQKNAPSVSR